LFLSKHDSILEIFGASSSTAGKRCSGYVNRTDKLTAVFATRRFSHCPILASLKSSRYSVFCYALCPSGLVVNGEKTHERTHTNEKTHQHSHSSQSALRKILL
jgi:hypothetical protein